MKTQIKIELPNDKRHNCPICNYENNFFYGDTCEHVDRITAKRVIIYRLPIFISERICGSIQKVNINVK